MTNEDAQRSDPAAQAVRAALEECDNIQREDIDNAVWQTAETIRAVIIQHLGPDGLN